MYKKLKDAYGNLMENCIFHSEIGYIPNDSANRHWQAYQEWLAQGNQPLAAD